MRLAPITLAALVSAPLFAAPPPDTVCKESKVLYVEPGTLRVQEREGSTVYRFQGGKLYVKSGNDPEYLYNSVSEAEPNRYVSGHKTIYFQTGSTPPTAHVTHVYRDEVRISVAACQRK